MTTSRPRLPLNQLNFGKIDAKNEVVSRDLQSIQHFVDSFTSPTGLDIDDFVHGRRAFVHGMKGSGKTALLRYIQLKAKEDSCLTRFISFSINISDSEREKIFEQSDIKIYEDKQVDVGGDCINIWLIFIMRQIVHIIEENSFSFSSSHSIRVFCDLIKRLYDGEEKGLLNWLINTVKKGKYKIKSKHFDAKFDPGTANDEKDYSVDIIIQQAFLLLKDLSWEGHKRIYLFFDELNLSFASKKQHRRDSILIRDLVIAIDRINTFLIDNEKPLFILGAIRSEVLNAVSAPTNEINKILADQGHAIRWHSQTASNNPPIIQLVTNKIHASERIKKRDLSKDVFESYFNRGIFGIDSRQLIIELTWCNPRDVVLLLGKAAAEATIEPFFGETVLGRALESYSAEAWREKAEELSVEYAPVEIQAIRKTLLAGRRYFKVSHFDSQLLDKGRLDQNIINLKSKRSSAKILEDLYRIGVIGQSSREPAEKGQTNRQFSEHWSYRGHDSFDIEDWMIIHKALWFELRLGRIQANPGYSQP